MTASPRRPSRASRTLDSNSDRSDRGPGSPASSTPAELRRQLRQLDQQWLQLAQQRARVRRQLAQRTGKADDRQLDRTDKRLVETTDGPLPGDSLAGLLHELETACRSEWDQVRVAFLGPQYSYSHLAATERFGQTAELLPMASIAAVFRAVERGDAQYGLVPIENSTDGRIVDTLEMFVASPARICGEVSMPIHHHLLGKGRLAEVREVHSKPQAISQCRRWLSDHLPNARQVAAASTTAAAERAAEDPSVAAIASRQAGKRYGLVTLAAAIEDNPNNITRFAVIGPEPAARTGSDKTSLMLELPHRPGALADVMGVFKRNRLNLTWIESFPKKGSGNEYWFFIELEGHPSDLPVRKALKALASKTVRTELLGSYAQACPP